MYVHLLKIIRSAFLNVNSTSNYILISGGGYRADNRTPNLREIQSRELILQDSSLAKVMDSRLVER